MDTITHERSTYTKPSLRRRAGIAAFGVGLACVGLTGACSITSDDAQAEEQALPAPKRQIIAEVLGVVATPEPTAVPPTTVPEPTPTLTASRVVVYSTGDWIIDGDEIVTIHDGPGGEPVGAVALGVQVSATGAGRVLGGVTWVEIELPDGQTGYVPSGELRVANHNDPEPTPDGQGLLGKSDPIVVTGDPLVGRVGDDESSVDGSSAGDSGSDQPSETDSTSPPPSSLASADTAADQLGAADTFVIAAFDPNDNEYIVTGARVGFWVEIDQELIQRWDLANGMVVEVNDAMGRVIDGVPFAAVTFRTIDGWIDVRELRRASAQAQ